MRRLISVFLLPTFVALAGCSSTPSEPVPVTKGDITKDVFVQGFEDIDTFYITKQDMGALAIAGLQQLTNIDPDVAVVPIENQLNLDIHQQMVDSFQIKADMKASQWGKLVAKITQEAVAKSEKLQKTPSEKVYEAVLTGAVSKLDPFSHYDNPIRAAEQAASRDGFGGLGITISVEDGSVRVVSIIHYTPAERMGLKRDDLVLAIDGKGVTGLSQDAVVKLLRGDVGSQVTLTLSRAEDAAGGADAKPRKVFKATLTRAHVIPETVAYHREGDIAYIRIYSFNSGTEENVKHALFDAKSEIGSRLAGYILDLRDNPGGLLNQSVAVSNLFLTGGQIVSTQGRHPDSHQFFEASGNDVTDGKPIVVLIDGNSASAAEIVTAALQDNDRAAVVGSNSYGKGTVQTVLNNMPNKSAMTLTWARYHAPSGYTLHHLGVLPTICTVGKHDADALIKDLTLGRLPVVPTERRNAVAVDDTAGLDALRKTCPARLDDDPIDLDVAKRLLHQPKLFAQAVRLAQPPATANSDQSSSLNLLPAFLN